MTYAMVDAAALGFGIEPSEARDLCVLGQRSKMAGAAQLAVAHPENLLMPGLTNTEFMGPIRREGGHLVSRNTVVVSPGCCDRPPCGTGSSARLALMHAEGEMAPGETLIHESITGSRFTCEIDGLTRVGPYDAVISAIAGQA